jgi:hypothetical protein
MIETKQMNDVGTKWKEQWHVLARILDLHALRNSRQENCIILLIYTSGVIENLHSPILSYIKVLLLKKIHLWHVQSTATFISISVNKDRCIFPFNAPVPVQVFTSGTVCSQAALVRCYFSHSLFWNMDSSHYGIPSVALKPQTDSVPKSAGLQYYVWFSAPHSVLSLCSWYITRIWGFRSWLYFLLPPVGDCQDILVTKA